MTYPTTRTYLERSIAFSLLIGLLIGLLALVPGEISRAAENDTALKQALSLRPVQNAVDFAVPTAEEASKCTIKPIRIGKSVGYLISDPSGLPLRRFLDTNGDSNIDQWCYFQNGLEVYRDLDTNFNRKTDQYRWFNTGGTRWGIDQNEDGLIDSWKTISPEEVSAEAVAALAAGDVRRFSALALTSSELQSLGLGQAKSDQLREMSGSLIEKFRAIAAKKPLSPGAKWLQLSVSQPGVVPAGTDGSTQDICVYENTMAIAEDGATHAQVLLGTLIRVGEVWKLISPPAVETGSAATVADATVFFQPPQSALTPGVASAASSERLAELVGELEKADDALAQATTPQAVSQLTLRRVELIQQIAAAADTTQERLMWLNQAVDVLSAAAQSGQMPDAPQHLEALFVKLSRNPADRPVAAYAKFRALFSAYNQSLQAPNPQYAKIQEQWTKDLTDFCAKFADVPIAAEGMLQLAITLEFEGNTDEAKKWYGRVVTEHGQTQSARKAAGCRTRLDAVGKPIAFTGPTLDGRTFNLAQYRGRTVLLQFWATWCDQCTAATPTLAQLQQKYNGRLNIIGVCLDTNRSDAVTYLRQHPTPWPQVFEEGGLDSGPANSLGILSLPTMVLIDPAGNVVDFNVQQDQLETKIQNAIQVKTAAGVGPTGR